MAEEGVSGSMSPVRIFFSSGTLPTFMHIGSAAQGFGGLVYFRTNVLRAEESGRLFLTSDGREGVLNLQHRISHEEHQNPKGDQCQTADIDETSSREDITFSLFRIVRVRIVQPIILLDILRKQQQPGGRQYIVLL